MGVRLAFIGIGEMGRPLVLNLLRGGYAVRVFDLDAERMQAVVGDGAEAAGSVAESMDGTDYLLASLPSSDSFVRVAETEILPRIEAGQVVVDLGTTTPPETRRLAALFAERGAALVEAPVSGGPGGAERADLLMFTGGDSEAVERVRPVLETLTRAERITYCGPSGCGQVVKGVNQLMMGLGAAAYVETMAFGVRAGVDPEVIRQAIAPEERYPGRWREDFGYVAAQVAAGRGEEVGVKFRELPYFLHEAAEAGLPLPLTETLYRFLEHGERVVIDDHRPAPSYWHQLHIRKD